jgi:hypothetical protein
MKAYSFKNTILVLNGVEITGWDEGDDVIDIKRLADSASHKIGAAGDMMVALSADRSAEVSIKLQQTSSSNAYIGSLIDLQEGGAETFVPISLLFQDTYRNDMAEASAGYIKKPADMKRGTGVGPQEWTFVLESLSIDYGD